MTRPRDGSKIRLEDTFEALLMDVLQDVVLAKQIDKDRQATMSETDSSKMYYAWDRAANSLRLLQLYCEQHRDQQTRPMSELGQVRSAED